MQAIITHKAKLKPYHLYKQHYTSLSLCKLRLNKNGNWEEEVDVIGAMEGRRGSHGRVPRREAQSHKAAAWSRVSDARASQEERQVQTPRP